MRFLFGLVLAGFIIVMAIFMLFFTGCAVSVDCTPCGTDLNGAGQCCDEYSECVSIDDVLECQRK